MGSSFKINSKSFYSQPLLPHPPPPPSTLSLTAGVSPVFIFLYDEKRKQQQQQSTKNTRHDKTKKSQNLFNLLNDGFNAILLFCRDIRVFQGPTTNERTILRDFIAKTLETLNHGKKNRSPCLARSLTAHDHC